MSSPCTLGMRCLRVPFAMKGCFPPLIGPDHPSARNRRINSLKAIWRGRATCWLADHVEIDGLDLWNVTVLVDDLQEHPFG